MKETTAQEKIVVQTMVQEIMDQGLIMETTMDHAIIMVQETMGQDLITGRHKETILDQLNHNKF